MENIPTIALGTWKSTNPAELIEAVRYAVEEAGYRHIDCAAGYGNEKEVGTALKSLFERGVVKREEVWITTKIWNSNHRADLVEPACRESLEKLQLDYVDLYLMHYPSSFIVTEDHSPFPRNPDGSIIMDHNISFFETWKAMEALVDKGLCKHIGVSNFTINMLERMKYSPDVRIQPYANQVEYHLYMQQQPMRDYLKQNNIVMEGYSTLGTNDWRKPDEPCLLKDPVLNAVATELNQPVGSVELRFLQQNNPGVVLLAKSVHAERIKSNINLNFDLTEDQLNRLRKCEKCYRFVNPKKNWQWDVLGDGW